MTNKSAAVNPLVPDCDASRALFASTGERVARKKAALKEATRASRAAADRGAASEALAAAKAAFVDAAAREARAAMELPALAAPDAILSDATRTENMFVAQPQQRNLSGRVFGGFLLRRAFELAFATSYVFGGARPRFKSVRDMDFLRPVDVGDLLRFKARVLHVDATHCDTGQCVDVEVECLVTKPESRSAEPEQHLPVHVPRRERASGRCRSRAQGAEGASRVQGGRRARLGEVSPPEAGHGDGLRAVSAVGFRENETLGECVFGKNKRVRRLEGGLSSFRAFSKRTRRACDDTRRVSHSRPQSPRRTRRRAQVPGASHEGGPPSTMVARRTSSAGFVAGARPDGVVGALRRADFYARLPSELAEGSVVGGVVSVFAAATFAALLVAQTRALRTVGTRTDIVVDHEPDRRFQVNFKLELPELSCEWATVDVVDALGARRFNVTGEQLYKHAMGASHYLGVEHATHTAARALRRRAT